MGFSRNTFTPSSISHGSDIEIWWVCILNHSWSARVSRISAGHGCPFCSGLSLLKGFNDLETKNPKLAKEWDYTKNAVVPSMVMAGTHEKAWWICGKCSNSWNASIVSRVSGNGCFKCYLPECVTGFNDLKTIMPILLEEWNYQLNTISPSKIKINSSKKINWRCKECLYEWKTSLNKRTRNIKPTGCPACCGRVVVPGKNDLETKNSILAREWDEYKNNGLLPSNVTANSNKTVWWKCYNGHNWKARVYSRNSGKGCPKCILHGTSKLELTLAYYLHKNLGNIATIYSGKEYGRKIDIIIESDKKKIHVEYDGSLWHKDISKDIKRDDYLLDKNKDLIIFRLREKECPEYISNDFRVKIYERKTKTKSSFYAEIEKIISDISSLFGEDNMSSIEFETNRDIEEINKIIAENLNLSR